jgi:hypothetical protein
VPFFGKLICVSALWLPILSAQSVRPPTAKVQLPRVSDFEQKIDSLVERFSTSGRTLVDSSSNLLTSTKYPWLLNMQTGKLRRGH